MKFKKKVVKPSWVVLARHYGMTGGVFDYGMADIKEFFENKDEAIIFARELAGNTFDGLVMPIIWVLKCEVTFKKVGDEYYKVVNE